MHEMIKSSKQVNVYHCLLDRRDFWGQNEDLDPLERLASFAISFLNSLKYRISFNRPPLYLQRAQLA